MVSEKRQTGAKRMGGACSGVEHNTHKNMKGFARKEEGREAAKRSAVSSDPSARHAPCATKALDCARAQSRRAKTLGGAELRASVNLANHSSLPPPSWPRPAPPRPRALADARGRARCSCRSRARREAELRVSVIPANHTSFPPPARPHPWNGSFRGLGC